MANWIIEGYIFDDFTMSRVPVSRFPFSVGRQDGLELSLNSTDVSRLHANLVANGDKLILRDNNSTNGCFVNRIRIRGEQILNHGDVVHFANVEVRVILEAQAEQDSSSMTVIGMEALSAQLPVGIKELQEMIDGRMIMPYYQPLVNVSDLSIFGHESLGRGRHPNLSENPGPLFHISESFHKAVELSELFREEGIKTAHEHNYKGELFLNIHPDEMHDTDRLFRSLQTSQQQYPNLNLVLEIHEQAVTDIELMKDLGNTLDSMDIKLAYDDFGAGQARLLELIEAPAAYLKFDMALLRDIDKADEKRRKMVKMLVAMCKSTGSKALAEGISSEGEAKCCIDLEFDCIQGFYYGRPGTDFMDHIVIEE
ncbi:MAG: EAL domain-containing protein (putative c-di-GMP-specific phosphodiesterase class I) [Pseudomonadales bacterium]|jgi:EAL domain-containing protein (putative c-di-GMP-specific phosphodiesterase class I)